MATPAIQALAEMDEREKTDICFDYHWAFDNRISSIEDLVVHMPFVGSLKRYPGDCEITDYDRWFITCQSELSRTCTEIKARLTPGFRLMQMSDYQNSSEHEIDINLQNVFRMGFNGRPKPPYVPIGGTPMLEGERPYIGLCNGAFKAPMWEKKHWPHFAQLSEYLKKFFGGTIFGIGGDGELENVTLDVDFCGRLKMTETTKALSQLDLFITTDTGCMHAADALGVPLIALFGPTMTTKNGPRGSKSYVIRSDLSCSPCYFSNMFFECDFNGCMYFLDPEYVMAKSRQVMGRHYGH